MCMLQVSVLGAGLLLGSALGIILPEGFEAAREAGEVRRASECSQAAAALSLSLSTRG